MLKVFIMIKYFISFQFWQILLLEVMFEQACEILISRRLLTQNVSLPNAGVDPRTPGLRVPRSTDWANWGGWISQRFVDEILTNIVEEILAILLKTVSENGLEFWCLVVQIHTHNFLLQLFA